MSTIRTMKIDLPLGFIADIDRLRGLFAAMV